jgi:hypothetical protein
MGESKTEQFKRILANLQQAKEGLGAQYTYFNENNEAFLECLPDVSDQMTVSKSREKVKQQQKQKQKQKEIQNQVSGAASSVGRNDSDMNLAYTPYISENDPSVHNIGGQTLNMTPQMEKLYKLINRFDGTTSIGYLMQEVVNGRVKQILCTEQDYHILLNKKEDNQKIRDHRGSVIPRSFFQLTRSGVYFAGGNQKHWDEIDPSVMAKYKFFMGLHTFTPEETEAIERILSGPDSKEIDQWIDSKGTVQQRELVEKLRMIKVKK